jgi:hypothetical protein
MFTAVGYFVVKAVKKSIQNFEKMIISYKLMKLSDGGGLEFVWKEKIFACGVDRNDPVRYYWL